MDPRPVSPASDTSDLFEAQEQAAAALDQQLTRAASIALHSKQYGSHTRLRVRMGCNILTVQATWCTEGC